MQEISDVKKNVKNIRQTSTSVGGAESFPEIAALILARRFGIVGRKKDARKVLTSYLQYNKPTHNIMYALNSFG